MNSLPQVVLNALTSNTYIKRDGLSATTLIKPPQMRVLENRYGPDDIAAIDNLWSVFGTAVHHVMEQNAESEAIVEGHYALDIHGVSVHGTADHYLDGTLSDFKVTSAWKFVGQDFDDWEKQLNIYIYLMRDTYPVHTAQIIAIFRDWSKMKALQGNGYPQSAVEVINIPIWTTEQQYEYISERVLLHKQAEEQPDESLPPCSDKERWYTGTRYAVMKHGNKRAIKLHDTLFDAEQHALGDPKYYVEERPGENKRCEQYCPVASKCQQLRRLRGLT